VCSGAAQSPVVTRLWELEARRAATEEEGAMARARGSPLDPLASPRVREAARRLLAAVAEEDADRSLAPAAYARAVRDLERLRGRSLTYPALLGGGGRGARVRLADGSVKLDFIGGIGVHPFGHADPELLETAVVAAARDTVFQGHLTPGPEYLRLTHALLRHAGPPLAHAWLSVSGAIANENALKIVLQKHSPADRIVVFERGFAGRTLVLAELTDKPAFREGLPTRGMALHVPFHDPRDAGSTAKSLAALDGHLARHPGRVAAMLFELVQGEGGIHVAPREFFLAVMRRCREAGIAVWVDEVQTFARTAELFAFRTLGLQDWVDVVTVGKALQGSAVLFTKDYNPRPGLVAGTYAGATVGMAVGTRIIERLESEGYLGSDGKIARLGLRVARRVDALRKRLPRLVGEHDGMGAMHALTALDGSPDAVKRVIEAAFQRGPTIFGAGERPSRLRLLLPMNASDQELDAGFAILEDALRSVAKERGLPATPPGARPAAARRGRC
jgi:4-aminobutyrate aminotransferase-like enzyme